VEDPEFGKPYDELDHGLTNSFASNFRSSLGVSGYNSAETSLGVEGRYAALVSAESI